MDHLTLMEVNLVVVEGVELLLWVLIHVTIVVDLVELEHPIQF